MSTRAFSYMVSDKEFDPWYREISLRGQVIDLPASASGADRVRGVARTIFDSDSRPSSPIGPLKLMIKTF